MVLILLSWFFNEEKILKWIPSNFSQSSSLIINSVDNFLLNDRKFLGCEKNENHFSLRQLAWDLFIKGYPEKQNPEILKPVFDGAKN